jgi:hypothetical protein
MFRTVVLEIGAAKAAKQYAFRVEQAGAPDFPKLCPPGGPIGGYILGFPSSPDDIATAATIAAIPPEPAI